MSGTSRTPAVVAGLFGAAIGTMPTSAFAAGITDIDMSNTPSEFLLGVAVGAFSCGIVTTLVSASEARRTRREAAEHLDNTAMAPKKERVADPSEDSRQAIPSSSEESKTSAARFSPSSPLHLRDEATSNFQGLTEDQNAQRGKPGKAAVEVKDDPEVPYAEHKATDYADIASNYVQRLTWKQRMASRARGVKELLAERMSQDMFDDLPVIERADGSVGDVGTGWWNAALKDSIRHDYGTADESDLQDIDMTGEHGPLDVFQPAYAAEKIPASYSTGAAAVTQAASSTDVTSESTDGGAQKGRYQISQRLAYIDEAAFPEKSEADTFDSTDAWELSMARMDAQREDALSAEAAQEAEEKRAAESPTAVLPFRPPAGHPEVVDTDSYVDYLIKQEFSRSSSQAVRMKSRDYLHVMEGGSQAAPTVFAIRGKHESYHPKHMAKAAKSSEQLWANEA